MLDLNRQHDETSELIPRGFLCWAYISVRGHKRSKGGGAYYDLELTIAENQKYARKKLWINVMDPDFADNSDGAKNMGLMQLKRILEVVNKAGPENPHGYQIHSIEELSGQKAAVRVGVEKGQGSYPDKNVPEFLSPLSSTKSIAEAFAKLVQGQNGLEATAGSAANNTASSGLFGNHQPQTQPAPSGVATAPQTQPGATPSWLANESQGAGVGGGSPNPGGGITGDDEIPF